MQHSTIQYHTIVCAMPTSRLVCIVQYRTSYSVIYCYYVIIEYASHHILQKLSCYAHVQCVWHEQLCSYSDTVQYSEYQKGSSSLQTVVLPVHSSKHCTVLTCKVLHHTILNNDPCCTVLTISNCNSKLSLCDSGDSPD